MSNKRALEEDSYEDVADQDLAGVVGRLSVARMRSQLQSVSLATDGTKPELAARLVTFLQGSRHAKRARGSAGGDDEELRAMIKCPVCLDAIRPPILQCPDGHLICKECRDHLDYPRRCPICRSSLNTELRTLVTERLVQDLEFVCKHDGCSSEMKHTELKDHESSCEHRPYSCPYNFDASDFCDWTGKRSDIAAHLKRAHDVKQSKLKEPKAGDGFEEGELVFSSWYDGDGFSRGSMWGDVVTATGREKVFLYITEGDHGGTFIFSLRHTGSEDTNMHYRLVVGDAGDSSTTFSCSGPISTMRDTTKYLAEEGVALELTDNQIRNVSDDTNGEGFRFHVTLAIRVFQDE